MSALPISRSPARAVTLLLVAMSSFVLGASCATRRTAPTPPSRVEAPPSAPVIPMPRSPPAASTAPMLAAVPLDVVPAPAAEAKIPAVEPTPSSLGILLPTTIRVGLETDLDVYIPKPPTGTSLYWSSGALREAVVPGLEVRPAAAAEGRGHYRIQVAALRDAVLAARQADDWEARTEQPADVVFDAGQGLFKVQVGRYPDRERAEVARDALRELGAESSWIVHEDRGLAEAGLELVLEGGRRSLAGRWLALESSDDVVEHGQQRFRGRLLLYLNDRGRLNLINELSFQDYLRGVVPMELGPELYPEIEALKAQAVAARTYTLRNLGEFDREGFDICASPRCQVYGGLAAERPLSDRAVQETLGEVLFFADGPADALYSAICGGHTEDVEVVFPERHEPYLKGVPCLESGFTALPSVSSRLPLLDHLASALASATGSSESSSAVRVGDRLAALVLRHGSGRAETLSTPPRSRHEMARLLTASLDLHLSREILAFLGGGSRPAAVDREERLLVALESALLPLDEKPLEPAAESLLVVELARYLGVYVERQARFQRPGDDQDEIVVAQRGDPSRWRLGRSLAGYREADGTVASAEIALAAGDPIGLHTVNGEVVAIVQQAPDRLPHDIHRSGAARWSRYRSGTQLRDLVARQFPGFVLRDLAVLEQGRSGRVASVELKATDGRRELVQGLAVRWLLDLPDTRFSFEPTQRAGESGWLFRGSGWGHGVGLCQTGAFGMAQRGLDYAQILTHYYSGVDLITLEGNPVGSGSEPKSPRGMPAVSGR